VADILTKSLAKGKFEMLRAKLGLLENTFLTKRELDYLVALSCSPFNLGELGSSRDCSTRERTHM
jgi:hypothetical protein